MSSAHPLVIVGGGLAGALAALRLAERHPDLPLLLVESGEAIGGNHTWSFFDSDVPARSQDLVAALQPVRWPRHRVHFPGRTREFAMAYNSIAAPALDALVRDRLAGKVRLGTPVTALAADGVELASGERIAARGVIDARGPHGAMPGLELGWQKFVGIEFAAAAPGIALVPCLAEGALAALDRGDGAGHDRLAAQAATALRDCDAIVLSQFSLARAAEAVARATGKTVLTTPDSAVRKLKRLLGAGP